jgi:hypothetical protein
MRITTNIFISEHENSKYEARVQQSRSYFSESECKIENAVFFKCVIYRVWQFIWFHSFGGWRHTDMNNTKYAETLHSLI